MLLLILFIAPPPGITAAAPRVGAVAAPPRAGVGGGALPPVALALALARALALATLKV